MEDVFEVIFTYFAVAQQTHETTSIECRKRPSLKNEAWTITITKYKNDEGRVTTNKKETMCVCYAGYLDSRQNPKLFLFSSTIFGFFLNSHANVPPKSIRYCVLNVLNRKRLTKLWFRIEACVREPRKGLNHLLLLLFSTLRMISFIFDWTMFFISLTSAQIIDAHNQSKKKSERKMHFVWS